MKISFLPHGRLRWFSFTCQFVFITAVYGCVNSYAKELRAIGVSVADLGNPFFVKIAESITRAARKMAGDAVAIYIRSSAYDLPRQEFQIDEFIRLRVDLIVLTAADSVKIESSIHKAQRSGIKVIAVDINAKGADVTITTDNVQAGEIACEYMAKRIDEQGNVVIINGASISSVLDRVNGCERVLDKYPKITVLSKNLNAGGTVEGGMEIMTYLLNAYEKIDGVFCINDPSAFGALTAAKQAGRREFIVTSVDGAPIAQQAIAEGSLIWKASAAQFPSRMATLAVELGIKLLNNEKIGVKKILIPTQLLTADNIFQYQGWGE